MYGMNNIMLTTNISDEGFLKNYVYVYDFNVRRGYN
jgi:hypothetical protein